MLVILMGKDFLHHIEEQDITFHNGEMDVHLLTMQSILTWSMYLQKNVIERCFGVIKMRWDPKYLAEELDRLGFPISDNLKISKAMRSDPSNVEVFKIIKNDDDKIAYAKTFLEG